MHARHTPRLASFDYIGRHRYSLTFCTHHRRPVFVEADTVHAVLRQFVRAADAERFALSAYCFMPDHVHLLVTGEADTSNAGRFIALAKQLSGYWYKQGTGVSLWQKFAWDRVLRTNDDGMTVTRYLLLNPVRAGLVSAPLDYPYSGSLVYQREELMDAFRDWRP